MKTRGRPEGRAGGYRSILLRRHTEEAHCGVSMLRHLQVEIHVWDVLESWESSDCLSLACLPACLFSVCLSPAACLSLCLSVSCPSDFFYCWFPCHLSPVYSPYV
ncbi:unnamed protein product [Arctogadus glacialis]